MTQDRASRLRNRRNRAKDRATGGDEADEPDERAETAEAAETVESSETAEPSKPDGRGESGELDEPAERDETAGTGEGDEPSGAAEEGETTETDDPPGESSVKDEQVGTYMYLPHAQKKELERTYNLLKAEYEFEYDEEFEKNRHFFPLVVRHGLDTLAEADASDVPRLLEDV
jgi:hypothetical protein